MGNRNLWYQVDKGDDDAATFFYYRGLAAKKAAPRYRRPLPLLTPEYLLGLPTFTLRYFEELYKRVKKTRGQGDEKGSRVQGKTRGRQSLAPFLSPPHTLDPFLSPSYPLEPFLLVLDNYQEAPASSMLHDIICGGMEIIPQGINVIAISRSAPPDAFARMRANERMETIGFDELRLTEKETSGIMKMKVKGASTGDCVQKALSITHGWAA